jgi:hypothetical protein
MLVNEQAVCLSVEHRIRVFSANEGIVVRQLKLGCRREHTRDKNSRREPGRGVITCQVRRGRREDDVGVIFSQSSVHKLRRTLIS